MSDTSKRPQVHEKMSNLSAVSSGAPSVSDNNEQTIGVLHGVSLPLGTQNQSSKTVSFDEDVEELNEFTIWGKDKIP